MLHQNSNQSKVICERCSFAKLLVTEVYIKKTSKQIFKWSKYNLGKFEKRNFKIVECKHIIKTFIQKFGV